jgi:hypothetical protein
MAITPLFLGTVLIWITSDQSQIINNQVSHRSGFFYVIDDTNHVMLISMMKTFQFFVTGM